MVKTSVNNLRHNDITKNQTEHVETIKCSLPQARFSMWQLQGRILLVEMLQLMGLMNCKSELVQKYPVYYEKPFHHKMKNNPWKIKNKKNKTVKAIKMFWSFRWCCLLCKLETKTNATGRVFSTIYFVLLTFMSLCCCSHCQHKLLIS